MVDFASYEADADPAAPTDAVRDSGAVTTTKAITIEGVTWESSPAYDGAVAGEYSFTPILPSGYTVAEGVTPPVITVQVGMALRAGGSTLENIKYIGADGNEKTCASATVVTGSDTEWGTSGNESWYVVSGSVSNYNRIVAKGVVHLILMDNFTLNANKGITVSSDDSLTIYAQSTDGRKMGKLTAKSGPDGAGIGGGIGGDGGAVTINGGTVTTTSTSCAGIGGGSASPGGTGGGCGTVIINGGTVTAKGSGGVGIGGGNGGPGPLNGNGGSGGDGGAVTISGGTVILIGIGGGIGGGAPPGGSTGSDGDDGTFSTGASGNAFIIASSISDQSNRASWSGVIFEGTSGKVYGDTIWARAATSSTRRARRQGPRSAPCFTAMWSW